MDRREFIRVAGATAAVLAMGDMPALADDVPTLCSQARPGAAAYARVLRPGGKWVAVHHRPTGEVLAVVRCYAAAPVA